jgi:hypothetical protein
MICYNGAFVYNPTDDSFPKTEFRFPKEIVIEVLGRIKPHIKNIMCETDTDIWVDKEDQYLSKFFWYKDMNVHYGDLAKTLTVDPMTCIVQTPFEYRETKEVERELEKYEKINVRFWTGSPYFELFYEGTNKGAALVKICKYYGIPREDLIVFGDATNDVEMFEVAGTSILMSNAKHDLKEKTTMVSVKDNDHNGIYHTLKKLLK